MTTRIQITNGDESSPSQHIQVVVTCDGMEPQDIRLAPGESWNQWISTGHSIAVKELGTPKPDVEQQAAEQGTAAS